jgi:hypothetical protein
LQVHRLELEFLGFELVNWAVHQTGVHVIENAKMTW